MSSQPRLELDTEETSRLGLARGLMSCAVIYAVLAATVAVIWLIVSLTVRGW